MYYAVTRTDELQHHGVKGMKWGVRRYQNADGSLTAAGRSKYGKLSLEAINLKKALKTKSLSRNEKKEAKKKFASITEEGKAMEKNTKNEFKKDKKSYKIERNTGHKVASVLLMGPFGNMSYNTMRTAGVSRGKAIASNLLLNATTGGIGNIILNEVYKSEYTQNKLLGGN